MKRRFIPGIGIVLSLFSVSPLIGSDLNVEFLEGRLEYCEGRDSWISVEVGDTIPSGSRLKLSGRGYADLSEGFRKVTLVRDGLYEHSELQHGGLGESDIRKIIGSRYPSLLRDDEVGSAAPSPEVRGENPDNDESFAWARDSVDYLSEGKALFERGDIAEAAALFDEGTIWETGAVRRECLFRLAVCRRIAGNPRSARELLATISPESDDPYIGEYTVTLAMLFIESMDFDDAEGVLGFYLDANPRGDAAQAAWLLSAFSLEGRGDGAGRRESLREAVDLGPNTEIGRAAASMLN